MRIEQFIQKRIGQAIFVRRDDNTGDWRVISVLGREEVLEQCLVPLTYRPFSPCFRAENHFVDLPMKRTGKEHGYDYDIGLLHRDFLSTKN